MGILWSKFRSNPSPKELLEKITLELDDIYDRRVSNQLQHKRIVGTLIVFSVFVYIVVALVFFICYFPSQFVWQIVYSIPFIVFPLVIWLVKLGLHWYYKHNLSQNEDKVTLLLRQRKKLLDEVKEKETYKVAKELLEKYDPDQLNTKPTMTMMAPLSASVAASRTKLPDMEIRRRASFGGKRLPSQQAIPPPNLTTSTTFVRPAAVIKPGYNAPPGFNAASQGTVPKMALVRPSGIPLPCPILPRERGGFDRLMEYVLGDGPSNRYALICRQCQSHNGMALQEEFEYIAYRCCYCYYYNPARKQKPLPPRLSIPGGRTASDDQIKQLDLTMDTTVDSQAEDTTKETGDEEIVETEAKDKISEDLHEDATLSSEDLNADASLTTEDLPADETIALEDKDCTLEKESVQELDHGLPETIEEEPAGQSTEHVDTDEIPLEPAEGESLESLSVNDNLSFIEDLNSKSEILETS